MEEVPDDDHRTQVLEDKEDEVFNVYTINNDVV